MRLKASAGLALILAGCTATDQRVTPTSSSAEATDPATDPTTEEVPLPYPEFTFVEATGEFPDIQGLPAFANREDVYLVATSHFLLFPENATSVVPGDFYFDVMTSGGGGVSTLASLDDRSCRRFHVDSEGNIDLVYPGDGGCQHAFVTDPAGRGKLLLQLSPFSFAPIFPDYLITSSYCVTIRRAEEVEGGTDPDGAPCFAILAQCGDGSITQGEACDDGNKTDGDGCSATCAIEPPPPPPPAGTCGDGCVDEGEECDDGNTADGDGCSATCVVEHECDPTHEH